MRPPGESTRCATYNEAPAALKHRLLDAVAGTLSPSVLAHTHCTALQGCSLRQSIPALSKDCTWMAAMSMLLPKATMKKRVSSLYSCKAVVGD